MSIAQCALQLAIHRRYSKYGFNTRLSIVRPRCGRDSGCSGVRQRTHRHSSRTVLWSQRHHHRQRVGPLLTARWGRRFATRHARAEENRRRMVVGTGHLYPTQTNKTSFQETPLHRGRSTSAVAGRSRRLDEVEK